MKNEAQKMIEKAMYLAVKKAKMQGNINHDIIMIYYKEFLSELEYYSDMLR
ncbi:MAG: hypothetical protein IKP65_03505 [Alphaproteobacteria bacterium]|nr:hypothetical protein [Alphaproteobacteria bacterium]